MSTIAFDSFALTRIADFARTLSRLHQASRRRPVDDDQIDREFNAVCQSVWGYTTDDFSDDLFSGQDHAFLDSLDEAHARRLGREYIAYYHDDRTHLALDKDAPSPRQVEGKPCDRATLESLPRVGGLHHRYIWKTAA